MNRKYFTAISVVSLLFLINALWLWFEQNHDATFRADPIYPFYLRMRNLVLQPGSILAVACALAIWSGLIYWRSHSHPLSDREKILYVCVILSAIYGYVLTASFSL